MKKLLYIVALLLVCASANSAFAKALKGKVFGYDINQNKAPLQGVIIQWEDTKIVQNGFKIKNSFQRKSLYLKKTNI